jgi:hypothetical protein
MTSKATRRSVFLQNGRTLLRNLDHSHENVVAPPPEAQGGRAS